MIEWLVRWAARPVTRPVYRATAPIRPFKKTRRRVRRVTRWF